MVAHHKELHRKLEWLIDLLSAHHMKGDSGKEHDAAGPSRVEERESEMEDCGCGALFPINRCGKEPKTTPFPP